MISFICGQVADTTENSVIIETGGIGYEVFMTGTAIEQAVRMEGKVKVHTYFHVREDAMQLYGFWNKDDLQMFRLLLGVNGIGPKFRPLKYSLYLCRVCNFDKIYFSFFHLTAFPNSYCCIYIKGFCQQCKVLSYNSIIFSLKM